jgi:Reverse transcriptase (RNA-dependent DNA polymerase)
MIGQGPGKTRQNEDIEDTETLEQSMQENADNPFENEGEPFQNEGDLFQNEGDPDSIANEDEIHETNATSTPYRRSTRTWKPTRSYLESVQQEDLALASLPCCLEAINYSTQEEEIIACPISLMASTDQDTMYWDQAMKQPDAQKFLEAALDEIRTHEVNKHWEVIPIDQLPSGTPVLDPVWSMKRKRRLRNNEVYKHKARLNIHGGQQEYGVNYWETYAPVVTWAAIRLLLVLALMYRWHTVQIDFVLAYPQAPVECPLYMKIPKGFQIQNGNRDTHVLRILRNLY